MAVHQGSIDRADHNAFLMMSLPLALGYILVASSIGGYGGLALIAVAAPLVLRITGERERSYAWWLWLGVVLLAITPINTKINFWHGVFMASGMLGAVIIPYLLAHRRYHQSFIHMGLDFRRRWSRREIGFVSFAIIASGFWQFLYFLTTDAHHGWYLDTPLNILVTFLVIMIIGLWEEFFFIALVLTILKHYLSFWIANIIQGCMFTAFLYQFGFKGWILPLVFAYALYQGYVFHVTRSLLVTITIHVCVDMIVFIALLYSARPDIFGALI